MHQASEPVNFVAVHERLPAGLQKVLEDIVLRDDISIASVSDGLACISAWRRDTHGETQRDLKSQIKQAEREGRFEDALQLMKQLG